MPLSHSRCAPKAMIIEVKCELSIVSQVPKSQHKSFHNHRNAHNLHVLRRFFDNNTDDTEATHTVKDKKQIISYMVNMPLV